MLKTIETPLKSPQKPRKIMSPSSTFEPKNQKKSRKRPETSKSSNKVRNCFI